MLMHNSISSFRTRTIFLRYITVSAQMLIPNMLVRLQLFVYSEPRRENYHTTKSY